MIQFIAGLIAGGILGTILMAACAVSGRDQKQVLKGPKNKYYEFSDGFFTYFVNTETGEKKFQLEPDDEIVSADLDDFSRENS